MSISVGLGETADAYLLFKVGEEIFSCPILSVREVLRTHGLKFLPGAQAPTSGLVELRGVVLPVIDLRLWLGFEPTLGHESQRLVVVDDGTDGICLLIDEVLEVTNVAKEARVPVPSVGYGGFDRHKVQGMYPFGDRMMMVLDLECLLEKL